MAKSRILIVENAVDITGGLVSALRHSSVLRDHFDFTFVLPSGSRARKIVEDAGFGVHEMPFVEIRKSPVSLFLYFPALFVNALRLGKLAREIKPELIVSNDFYNLVPAASRVLGGKIPYVCFIRFVPSRFPSLLVKLWTSVNLKYAEKIIAVSEAVIKDCPVHKKIIRIYDPLPSSDLPYRGAGGTTTILCLANFIRGKGQQYVLESFARVSKEFPGWKVRFAGGDMGLQKNKEYKAELVALARKLHIETHTEWMPATRSPEDEYAQCAFSVNFSDSESFSLTCLESLYSGRTVIATRSGGPAEIIDDGITGILVPTGNLEEMTQALRKLMSDTRTREAMCQTAYREIRVKFNRAHTTDLLSAVYFSLTQPH